MEILSSLALAGFLGMLGQGLRAADGVATLWKDASFTAKFSWGRLVGTLAIGAGVGMAWSLGQYVAWENAWSYFAAGYIGTKMIEDRTPYKR